MRVDLRNDREVDVVEQVERMKRNVDAKGPVFVLSLKFPSVGK